MQPVPEFTTVPEIARGAGVTAHTVTAKLQRARVSPDAILSAGRLTMPLFALPRLHDLIGIVNDKAVPLEMEAR